MLSLKTCVGLWCCCEWQPKGAEHGSPHLSTCVSGHHHSSFLYTPMDSAPLCHHCPANPPTFGFNTLRLWQRGRSLTSIRLSHDYMASFLLWKIICKFKAFSSTRIVSLGFTSSQQTFNVEPWSLNLQDTIKFYCAYIILQPEKKKEKENIHT